MIRLLPVEELSSTIETAHLFFDESKLPSKFDFDNWMDQWKIIYNADIGCIFVYEEEGVNKGLIGGVFNKCMFTGEMEAIEAFWFVQKDKRGSGGGIQLIKALEDEAKKRGCKRIKMAYLMSVNPEAMSSVYERMGYEPIQNCVVKELP